MRKKHKENVRRLAELEELPAEDTSRGSDFLAPEVEPEPFPAEVTRSCKNCGCQEPYQGMTEECCLNTEGKPCEMVPRTEQKTGPVKGRFRGESRR